MYQRFPFSFEEDVAIIEYIVENDQFHRVLGMKIYQQMALNQAIKPFNLIRNWTKFRNKY